jgi:8-oxo-dGTP pyrophosphatase MutT (NUDIX family)
MSDKWTWATAPDSPGAGMIVVRQINKEWFVLGMWARGGYDIPKGHIEEDESDFEAALRECGEESNITNLEFEWGFDNIKIDKLILYVASTKQEGEIIPNAKTGIYEHESCAWLTFEEMKLKAYDYLKLGICWAESKVLNET